MSMDSLTCSLPAHANTESSPSVTKDSELEFSALSVRDPATSSIVPSSSAPQTTTTNPFCDGRVKIKHNMSSEEKRENFVREALATAPLSTYEHPPPERTQSFASSSAPKSASAKKKKKKNKKSKSKSKSTPKSDSNSNNQSFAEAAPVEKELVVEKGPVVEKEPVVETKYNPAAHTTPIRIYVHGNDPDYICPTPLQWKASSAKKWEEEKAKFVKSGLAKLGEFADKNDRTCVYYWEWVARGPNGEKVLQWVLFRDKIEGHNKRQNPVRAGIF